MLLEVHAALRLRSSYREGTVEHCRTVRKHRSAFPVLLSRYSCLSAGDRKVNGGPEPRAVLAGCGRPVGW